MQSEDVYWKIDKENQFRPQIDLFSFYTVSQATFIGKLFGMLVNFAKSYEDEPLKVQSFSPQQKGLYFWWMFDGEVGNGGIGQYYYNKGSKYVPSLIKGLKALGEDEVAQLIEKYHATYSDSTKTKGTARQRGMWGSDFSLRSFDNIYYREMRPTLLNRIEKFIRKHPEHFCVDAEGNPIDGSFTGKFKLYREDGAVRWDIDILNGVPHGKSTAYSNLGKVSRIEYYEDGKKSGAVSSYQNDGSPLNLKERDSNTGIFTTRSFYKNGKRKAHYSEISRGYFTGRYQTWYENGQVEKSGRYAQEEQNEQKRIKSPRHFKVGEWKEFYENGNPRLESDTKDGVHLLLNYWDEGGNQLLKNGTGFCISENRVGSSVFVREGHYKSFKPHGVMKRYRRGILLNTTEYVEGVRHGENLQYYDTGELHWKWIYNNGKVVSRETFKRDPKFKSVKVDLVARYTINPFEDETIPIPTGEVSMINKEQVLKARRSWFPMEFRRSGKTTLTHSFVVKVDAKGVPESSNFVTGGIGGDLNYGASLSKKLRFQPFIQKGEAVPCNYFVDVTYTRLTKNN